MELEPLTEQVIDEKNMILGPGFYEYVWDASPYPSGIYFYNMIYNGRSETYHKMMLLK